LKGLAQTGQIPTVVSALAAKDDNLLSG